MKGQHPQQTKGGSLRLHQGQVRTKATKIAIRNTGSTSLTVATAGDGGGHAERDRGGRAAGAIGKIRRLERGSGVSSDSRIFEGRREEENRTNGNTERTDPSRSFIAGSASERRSEILQRF
ncbi:hypothetical protein BDR05DRAFT_1005434 [Suillus weaverae]|nr:hypothetical protein BDR05DRAFT_1005434 [Suillus weaverae]